nr:reverse transcriptase domain-containing protein [Tanacetum cinerariifolium]
MWNQKEPEEDREEDPQENSEEECELKKKRLKEASESDSNTWPLDDSTSDDETDSELQSIARSKAKPKESEDTCESSVRPKLNSPKTIPAYTLPDFPSLMAPTRRSNPNNNGANPNIATIIAQQLQGIIPQIVTQVTNNVNNANANGGNDFKALLMEEFCPSNEMEKRETDIWNHAIVGANHAAYTDRFHELANLVPHLVTLESKRIERELTNEAVTCGTLSKSIEKRKEVVESSKEGGLCTNNKRAKVGKGFVVALPTRNEYVGSHP